MIDLEELKARIALMNGDAAETRVDRRWLSQVLEELSAARAADHGAFGLRGKRL